MMHRDFLRGPKLGFGSLALTIVSQGKPFLNVLFYFFLSKIIAVLKRIISELSVFHLKGVHCMIFCRYQNTVLRWLIWEHYYYYSGSTSNIPVVLYSGDILPGS